MPAVVLQLNRPVTTTEPTLEVKNRLPPGQHTFELVVEDQEGNKSAPARAVLTVLPAVQPPPQAR
jgi:hypothetical protein